jgi:signal transduction histidine kinase
MQHLIPPRTLGAREALLLVCLAAVPIGVQLLLVRGSAAAADAALLERAVAGVLFLVAALLLYLEWRVRASRGKAWVVAAMVLLACHLLGSAALGLHATEVARRALGWPLVVDLAVTGVVVALVAVGLKERPPKVPEPLLAGLALGAAGTIAKPALFPMAGDPPVAPTALVLAVMASYGVLATAVVLRRSLPSWLAWRLAVTLLLLSAAHVAASPRFPSPWLDVTAGTLLVLAGALWASTSFLILRTTLEGEHHRSARMESSLLAAEGTDRGTREALHELKATIAGLAKASELLADASLPTDVQQRLQQSLIRELGRLERRLWLSDATDAEVVDLDLTLDTVLDLHRARGRVVAWAPSGATVVGHQDAIAEAVNILLDNAATHGGSPGGRVDVNVECDADTVQIAVSDNGPGIPPDLRQRIFEWGERGPSSNGQGIGLNLARRLVVEEGGSLTLAEAETGSTFVIRLPAARQPAAEGVDVPDTRRSEETLDARAELQAF